MFSHLPQLNSIRAFEAAARLMSFKAAALELNVTPTAISHQIRGLEERLSTLLFERKARSIELTPEGEMLAQAAFNSLLELATVIEEMMETQEVLTISATTSFTAMWLVPRLNSFYNLHPEIQVVVKTGEHLDDLQKNRKIDLAIRYGEYSEQQEGATKLVTEHFGMYATKRYLDNLSCLEDATLLETQWQNASLPEISWKQYLKSHGNDIQDLKIRYYDQEHHVIQAALAGQGIALVSSLLVQTALEQGWLCNYSKDENIQGFTYYIVDSIHNKHSRKVKIFREWLINELVTESSF